MFCIGPTAALRISSSSSTRTCVGRPPARRRCTSSGPPREREVVAVHRADQRQVGQRLRRVARHPATDRVVLLRQQADVVGQADEDVEDLGRPLDVVGAREGVGEPERAGEERVLVAGDAVVRALGAGSGAAGRGRSRARRGSPRACDRRRGSSAGRKPTWASCSSAASVCSAPYDCTNVCRSAFQPCARTSAWMASRSARQRSTGASSPCFSAARTARSTAAHAITFECVKCRGSPRTSQMPRSGLRASAPSRSSTRCRCSDQESSVSAQPAPRARARGRTSPRRARRSAPGRPPRSRLRTGRDPA